MRPTELVPGNCYFSVGYGDQDMLVPVIQTLVYVGTEEDPENGRQLWAFRDPSFRGPVEQAEAQADEVVAVFPEEQLHGILDFDGLTLTLADAASEHPLHPLPASPGPASEAELATLDAELERFFQSAEPQSVTITVRFTDDGLSLTRRGDGSVDLLLFPHPRRDPDREAALRALCLSVGLMPREDYLANRGRTRVLAYPVPLDSHRLISRLSARMFLEVYSMRRGDILIYRFRSQASETERSGT